MVLQPGFTLDRYEVGPELGRGGNSVVYQGLHRRLGTVHALKVVDARDPLHRARALREARLQSTLRHRGIVAVTDVLECHGVVAIVLDLVSGPTLSTWLADPVRSSADRGTVLRRLVRAVAHTHEQGIVHRDLKPGNVLVDLGEGAPRPCLIDFGAARALDGPDSAVLTDPGTAVGTPLYMAPEQLGGRADLSPAVDVFALGCVLFEALYRCRPFGGMAPADLLRDRRAEAWNDPWVLRPDLGDHVHLGILGCLRADPRRRIPTAAVLARVLAGREDPRPWAPPRRLGHAARSRGPSALDSQWTTPGPTVTVPRSRGSSTP